MLLQEHEEHLYPAPLYELQVCLLVDSVLPSAWDLARSGGVVWAPLVVPAPSPVGRWIGAWVAAAQQEAWRRTGGRAAPAFLAALGALVARVLQGRQRELYPGPPGDLRVWRVLERFLPPPPPAV